MLQLDKLKMDASIHKILQSNYADGVFHTHISMIKPKGKFQLSRIDQEKFWSYYCDYIHHGDNPIIGVAEAPQYYLPVLADIDLCIKDVGDNYTELYSQDDLKFIVGIYQNVLKAIVKDITDDDLTCVILEKKMYTVSRNESTYFKHGFHLHFPYIFLNKMAQESQLIPRVQKLLSDNKIFEHLGIEDSGHVVDRSCCTVSWLLYGSRKAPDKDPYYVTKVVDARLKEITLEEAFANYEIYNNKERQIDITENVQYYLPRILSIVPYGRKTKEIRDGLVSPLKEKIRQRSRKVSSTQHSRMGVEEALEQARMLLPMLADHRAEDHHEWMTIGWVLYNISEGNEEGLDLWCDFSSRCPDKFDKNTCIYHWDRMVERDLTIGTLKYFASIDNPDAYKKYRNERCNKYIQIDSAHNDIARALHALYGDEYVCASYSRNIWYQFRNHHWEPIECGVFLREKISSVLVRKYTNMAIEINHKLSTCSAKDAKVYYAQLGELNKLIKKLKESTFKNNVMNEAKEVFYDPLFIENLDLNPYLVAFKNGVYDFKLNIFRPGRPEDYLSKTAGIAYREFNEDDSEVEQVRNFLVQIFPDKSVRKYFLDYYSEIFVGGNRDKSLVFWTGGGDNGKSITQKFFEIMLGKLTIKMDTNVLTGQKPKAGGAFPELVRAGGGIRDLTVEEPNKEEAVNMGIVKHLTGNDKYYARDLFEKGSDGREIQPLFKLKFICNTLPRMRGVDAAGLNRCKVLPFESYFCKPGEIPPDTFEEQLRQKRFPRDPDFDQKIPGMVQAFAWVLINHRKYVTKKYEPEKVRNATAAYRQQNDIYRQFILENITEDPKSSIRLSHLYSLFKAWFKESFPNHTLPVKMEVEEYFIKQWGPSAVGKKWTGYRQLTEKEMYGEEEENVNMDTTEDGQQTSETLSILE